MTPIAIILLRVDVKWKRAAQAWAWSTLFCLSAAAASDPLSLDQALSGLDSHPRLHAASEMLARFPRRQSLYLDCHDLGLGQAQAPDPDRNRPGWALLTPLAAQQLEVMERFFDVLLADFGFASESEAMAVAYVQFDRARARHELGQLSELRVLEFETTYERLLHRRTASELSQQLTRSLLAQALGRPGELPRDLMAPDLPSIPDPLPDLDEMLAKAHARRAVSILAAADEQADRVLIELELRQQMTELLFRLRTLGAALRSVRAESRWRDLKLDESRTLYEQEVTADLGYSMSQQTKTRMLEQRIGYCRALTWAELSALGGGPVWTEKKEEEP